MTATIVFACAVTALLMGCPSDSWTDSEHENYATALTDMEYVKVSNWEVEAPFPPHLSIIWDVEDADKEVKEVCPTARVSYDSQFHLLCVDCNNPNAHLNLEGEMVVLLAEGGKRFNLIDEQGRRNCADLEGRTESVTQILVGVTGLGWWADTDKFGWVDPNEANYATKLSNRAYLGEWKWTLEERFEDPAPWDFTSANRFNWTNSKCPEIEIEYSGGTTPKLSVDCVNFPGNKLQGELVIITRHGGLRFELTDPSWAGYPLTGNIAPYITQIFLGVTGFF